MSLIDLFSNSWANIHDKFSKEMKTFSDNLETIKSDPERKKFLTVIDMKDVHFPNRLEDEIGEVKDFHICSLNNEKGTVTGIVEFANRLELTQQLKEKYNMNYSPMTIAELKHFTKLSNRAALKVSEGTRVLGDALSQWWNGC